MCTIIIFQKQLVLKISNFHCFSKISTFKAWFKLKGLINRKLHWRCEIRGIDISFWLILGFLDVVVINSVIWSQSLIVSVQSWSVVHSSFHPHLAVILISLISKLVWLLQTVWQVLRVESIPLLIWLIYCCSVWIFAWIRELDKISLINIWSIFCIFSFVIWRHFKIVINHRENTRGHTFLVISNVLIQHVLRNRPLNKGLKFSLCWYKGTMP